MQCLATTKGPCPNILGHYLGDHGTLVLHAPGDKWFYLTENWTPADGLTKQQFIKLFHMAPPANVPIGWWGIVHGLTDDITCRDRNWTRAELQAGLDMFLDDRKDEYQKPDGKCWNPMSKGKFLANKRRMDRMIMPAPRPVAHSHV